VPAYTILWEFSVRPERRADFLRAYGAGGPWSRLMRAAPGFRGTQLLSDVADEDHFVTIDRWESKAAHEDFLRRHREEYDQLDHQCALLTTSESLLASWESEQP
jgi:heme-degrading monooxygenase HmoA